MIEVKGQQAMQFGVSIGRDVNGFPKLSKEASIKFWPMLSAEDREFLKQKYDLNLETQNG